MKESCIEKIQNIIENEATYYLDSSTLIYYLILRRYEFKIEFINKNRNIYEEIIMDSFFKTSQQKFLEEKNKILEEGKIHKLKRDEIRKNSFVSNFECKVEWPLCIFDTYYKHDITNYFIFKTFFDPFLIEDFYYNKYETYSIPDNLIKNKDLLENEEIILPPYTNISPKFSCNGDIKNQFILNASTPKKIGSTNIRNIRNICNRSNKNKLSRSISSKKKIEDGSFTNINKECDLKFNLIESVKKERERGRSHNPLNFFKTPYKNSNQKTQTTQKSQKMQNISLSSVKSAKINFNAEEISGNKSENYSKSKEGFSLIIEKNEDLSFYNHNHNHESSSGYDLENILIQSYEVENLNFYDIEEIKRLTTFQNLLIERRSHFCSMVENEILGDLKITENIEDDSIANPKKIISVSDDSYFEETPEKYNMSINSLNPLNPLNPLNSFKLHNNLRNQRQRYSLNIYNTLKENNFKKNLNDLEKSMKSRKREDSIKSFNEIHPYFSKQKGKYEITRTAHLDNFVIGSMISTLRKSASMSQKNNDFFDPNININPFKEESDNLSDLEEKDKYDHSENEFELEKYSSPKSPYI